MRPVPRRAVAVVVEIEERENVEQRVSLTRLGRPTVVFTFPRCRGTHGSFELGGQRRVEDEPAQHGAIGRSSVAERAIGDFGFGEIGDRFGPFTPHPTRNPGVAHIERGDDVDQGLALFDKDRFGDRSDIDLDGGDLTGRQSGADAAAATRS